MKHANQKHPEKRLPVGLHHGFPQLSSRCRNLPNPEIMVFYEYVVTAKNTARTSYSLAECLSMGVLPPRCRRFLTLALLLSLVTSITKKASLEVVQGGGIVRAVHNHGIRSLPHRFRSKYADKEGNRYYNKGRFISIYYDSNPATMRQVEQVLTMEEEILRNTHLKARSILDYVNLSREERNPYIKLVKKMQEKDRKAIHHRNETVEQTIEDMRIDDA